MLKTLMRLISLWTKLREDAARLRGLDDHLLADIGIERDQIEGFVLGRIEKPSDGVLPPWAEGPRRGVVRVPQVPRKVGEPGAASEDAECVPAE